MLGEAFATPVFPTGFQPARSAGVNAPLI